MFPFQTKEQLWPKPLVSKRCSYSVHVLHFASDIYFKRISSFFMLPPLGLWHHSLPHSTQEGHGAGASVTCVFKNW